MFLCGMDFVLLYQTRLCLLMMVVVVVSSFVIVNGLETSSKVTNSSVVYVIYAWFFSPIWFMESTRTLFFLAPSLNFFFFRCWSQGGPDNGPSEYPKVDDFRWLRRTKSDSHEYFRFLWFLVNEILFSFGPRPPRKKGTQRLHWEIFSARCAFTWCFFPWPKTITACVKQFFLSNLIQLVEICTSSCLRRAALVWLICTSLAIWISTHLGDKNYPLLYRVSCHHKLI